MFRKGNSDSDTIVLPAHVNQKISNPWNAKRVGDIPVPEGYTRVVGDDYADFLRSLPLKKPRSLVMLFTGEEADAQWLAAAVIDIPLLSNMEQCADMTMRIRAEYLFSRGRYDEIRFMDVNGKWLQYQGGGSRAAFEKYLRGAYGVCSTYSLSRETDPRDIADIEPGDVLVYPSRRSNEYGHAMIVVDVARKEGSVAIMCAEGYTPARDAHILRNKAMPEYNPWFVFNGTESVLQISAFEFDRTELRHY